MARPSRAQQTPQLDPAARLKIQVMAEKERRDRIRRANNPLFCLKDDPVAWIERYFCIPENGGKPIELAPYIRRAIREGLRQDENGNYLFSLILWGDIKKSGKSSIAAAIGLWKAFTIPWAMGKVVANDLKQAQSRVYYYMTRAIELHPELRAECRIKLYTIDIPAQHSRIEAVPIDPKGEAGGNDEFVIFSELWGAKGEAADKMWTEMTLSPTKFGKSFRWVETYAGFSGESPILENVYRAGVTEAGRVEWSGDFDPPLEAYENHAAKIFALWNTGPRLPWQSPEYYAQEQATLTPNQFARVHRNQWVSSLDSFVPIEWWDACRLELPPLTRDNQLIIAADAAEEQDCFAIVAVSGMGDDERYAVRYARAWRPPPGGTIHFHGEGNPEAELRRLIDQYDVVELTYDPYALQDMMQRFREDMIVKLHKFNQQAERAIADKQLYDMIKGKRILHGGDPDMRQHIQNANQANENGKFRIVKRNQSMKIDLAVALSMALDRAKHWRI